MTNIKRANTSGITKTGTAIPDVPDAPTIGTATAVSDTTATIAYTAATTGGTATTFTATSTPGSITGTGTSPITVSGLTGSTSYTFTVKGTNATATGPASSASNSITTSATPYYVLQRVYNGSSTTSGENFVKDSSGNIYVASQDLTHGTGGYYASFVVKLNSSGVVQWSKYWTNQGYSTFVALASNGDVLVQACQDNRLVAFLKLDASTGAKISNGSYYNSGAGAYRQGIVVDSSGNIWNAGGVANLASATGVIKVPSNLGTAQIYGFGGTYSDGVFVDSTNAYSSLCDTSGNGYRMGVASLTLGGSFNWCKYFGTTYSTGTPSDITSDSSGNVYVARWMADSGTTGAYGFVVKLNSSGAIQWQRSVDVTTSNGQYFNGVAVDSSGNVYAVGVTTSTSPQTGMLVKFNSSGTVQWQRSLSNSNLSSVKVLPGGELGIVGTWKGLSSGGSDQTLYIQVPADGSKTGTYTVGGTSVSYAASSFTIATSTATTGDYATAFADTSTLSAATYSPTLNDYSATQQVVTI